MKFFIGLSLLSLSIVSIPLVPNYIFLFIVILSLFFIHPFFPFFLLILHDSFYHIAIDSWQLSGVLVLIVAFILKQVFNTNISFKL